MIQVHPVNPWVERNGKRIELPFLAGHWQACVDGYGCCIRTCPLEAIYGELYNQLNWPDLFRSEVTRCCDIVVT